MRVDIQDFLPGTFHIAAGAARDYARLERFHYRNGRPATFAAVWTVHYLEPARAARLAAVAVLSFPPLASAARERALGLAGMPPGEKAAFLNAHVRTISRVIVHPQFRGLGLASRLVHHICHQCTT